MAIPLLKTLVWTLPNEDSSIDVVIELSVRQGGLAPFAEDMDSWQFKMWGVENDKVVTHLQKSGYGFIYAIDAMIAAYKTFKNWENAE